MRKIDTNQSILMLKQRFNEIKKNIIMKEQNQPDSPLTPNLCTPNFPTAASQTQSQPPSRHSIPSKPDSLSENLQSRLTHLQNQNKKLQIQLQTSENSRKELLSQIQELKETIRSQNVKISLLKRQNQNFKYKNSPFQPEKQHKRPQSCMRNSMSPIKNLRVAFSKELVQVLHINEEECPNQVLKTQDQQQVQDLRSKSPELSKTNISPIKWYQRVGQSRRSPIRENSRTSALQEKRALLNSLNQTAGEFRFSSFYKERSKHLAGRFMELE